LLNSGKYFPKNTIHVIVVDPGIGSIRLPILIKTKKYFLIGPDNGVLSLLACNDGIDKIIALENKRYFMSNISNTFHGSDIFAPIAAHCANGVDIENFGEEIKNIEKNDNMFYSYGIVKPTNEITFNILDIDNFGNIITNIPEKIVMELIDKLKKTNKIQDLNNIIIRICKGNVFDESKSFAKIEFPFKRTYSEVRSKDFVAILEVMVI